MEGGSWEEGRGRDIQFESPSKWEAARWQEQKAAHVASAVGTQRKMNWSSLLLSPLFSRQDSGPRNGATHIYVHLLSSVSPT